MDYRTQHNPNLEPVNLWFGGRIILLLGKLLGLCGVGMIAIATVGAQAMGLSDDAQQQVFWYSVLGVVIGIVAFCARLAQGPAKRQPAPYHPIPQGYQPLPVETPPPAPPLGGSSANVERREPRFTR